LPLTLSYYLRTWNVRSDLNRLDRETGSLLVEPHSEYLQLSPDGRFLPVQIDSWGMRNSRNYSGEPLVVLGDSFVFGVGVAKESRFSELLQSRLNAPVYNMGISHSAPPQQLRLLRRFFPMPREYPETIIWTICSANDVQDSSGFIKWQAEKSGSSQPADNFRVRAVVSPLLRYLYSMRLALLGARMLNQAAFYYSFKGDSLSINGQESFFFFPEAGYLGSAGYEKGLDTLYSALMDLNRETETAGKRLFIFYLPSKEEAYVSPLMKARPELAQSIISFDSQLLSFCALRGLRCVSLKNAFQKAAERGEGLYFLLDGHWNASGHALAAEMIAGAMASLN
jgi:hypothetical protein